MKPINMMKGNLLTTLDIRSYFANRSVRSMSFTLATSKKMKNLIQHIKSQVSITDEKIELILNRFVEKHFDKKEYLLLSGNKSNYEFFITNGCVRTFVTDSNGAEHNIYFSIENWWSGDLQSFIDRIPAQYSIQAIEKTSALAISHENWKFLTIQFSEFSNYSRILFRNAVIGQQNRIVQNLSFTAKERYDFFVDKYPKLVQRITQKHIASYLGITPEFLSMIRNRKRN